MCNNGITDFSASSSSSECSHTTKTRKIPCAPSHLTAKGYHIQLSQLPIRGCPNLPLPLTNLKLSLQPSLALKSHMHHNPPPPTTTNHS
ncbi:hypothetical protein CEXT_38741 [Caerostris extrusa]|uniref:Uncharacterized protein n=1 Tax=Caerostris extrusa TaxID=172846 RepID=A0AAV4UIH3_CAEEX|nr:hypothetical protein CEXT_38741 [Caerostris extrusa]